jgi:hydroxymethylpyrimidine pyrophosphatase-like HAD family hydrolase
MQLSVSDLVLRRNSKLLQAIAETLRSHNFTDLLIDEKYTSNREILIGLTVDYRRLENWHSFKENVEPPIKATIQREMDARSASYLPLAERPFIQSYASHPFLDVYGVRCNKGLAIDSVLSCMEKKVEKGTNMMYLGDSENDNPAFRKSDISIGISSDKRLSPNLECKYTLDFDRLPSFLQDLIDNALVFSEKLLAR